MYIFSPYMYPEDISKEIGIRYKGKMVKGGSSLFIFVNKGKIVKVFLY
jgi:hypothetical protein